MRLIDADKIDFSEVFIGSSDFAKDARMAAQMLIDKQPTIDPVKHGRWIPTCENNSTGPLVRCSCCGMYINPSATTIELKRQKLEPKYCENCGAKMEL